MYIRETLTRRIANKNLSIRSPGREPQSWQQGATKDVPQPRSKLSYSQAPMGRTG